MLVADPVSQLRFEQLMVPCALHFRNVATKFSKSVPPVFNAYVAFPRRRLLFLVVGCSFFVLMATGLSDLVALSVSFRCWIDVSGHRFVVIWSHVLMFWFQMEVCRSQNRVTWNRLCYPETNPTNPSLGNSGQGLVNHLFDVMFCACTFLG